MRRALLFALALSGAHGPLAGAARADWAAAANEPLTSSAPRPELTPIGPALRVRLRADGPTWTARVYECERPVDAALSEDPGCGMLVLKSGKESRYLLLDGDYAVSAPRLLAVKQPQQRSGLVLVDARGLTGHADTWTTQLIEDDGRGPRLVMRAVIDSCSWGDDGAKCTPVRPAARYLDVEGDGDLDLELSFQGGNGMRRRDLFARQASGRFLLPARYVASDSAIAELHKIAAPIGVEAPSAPPPKCAWSVKAPRSPIKAHGQRGGKGPMVGTLADQAPVELAEVRGGWSRLSVPLAGWVPTASLVERCL